MKNRMISLCLAVAMVIAMLPAVPLQANAANDAYASVVEKYMEDYDYDKLNGNNQKKCRGLLYDLDGNGQDELILQYSYGNSSLFCSVWTIADEKPICVFEYSMGDDDKLSLVNMNNEPYLVMETVSDQYYDEEHYWWFFRASGSCYEQTYSAHLQKYSDGEQIKTTYYINDGWVEESEFVSFLESLDNQKSIPLDAAGITFRVLAKQLKGEEIPFVNGDGTVADPYQVSTPEQLNAVRQDLSAHYIQTADINLEGIEWDPIGHIPLDAYSDYKGFMGSYDGNGYTISNMSITQIGQENVALGLFGYNQEGILQNIELETVKISVKVTTSTFPENTGAFCALVVGGIAGHSSGTIKNCVVNGCIDVSSHIFVPEAEYENNPSYSLPTIDMKLGGIVGMGSCSGCVNYAEVHGEGSSGRENDSLLYNVPVTCGGITGFPGTVNNRIEYCINYGNIYSASDEFAISGGISGEDGSIYYCANYGEVVSSSIAFEIFGSMGLQSNAGGIVGLTSADLSEFCVNFGDVSAEKTCEESACTAGGIAGWIGYFSSGFLKNCYNLGNNIHADITTPEDPTDPEIFESSTYVGAIYGAWAWCYDGSRATDSYTIDDVVLTDVNVDYVEGFDGILLSREEMMPKVQKILEVIDGAQRGFIESLYRADYLLDSDTYENLQYYKDLVNNGSMSQMMCESGELKAMNDLWTSVSLALDQLVEGDALLKYQFNQSHLYETILLNALEAATNTQVIDKWALSSMKKISGEAKKLLKLVEDAMNVEFDFEMAGDEKVLDMTEKQRKALKDKLIEKAGATESISNIGKINKYADVFDKILLLGKTVEESITLYLAYVNLWSMSDAMGDVLEEMLRQTPEDTSHHHMRTALEFCIRMIRESNEEQFNDGAIVAVLSKCAGATLITEGISTAWGNVVKLAAAASPELKVLLFAYKAGRVAANYIAGTDAISEQTFKVVAVDEYYSVLNPAINVLAEEYRDFRNEENAEAMLSSVLLLFGLGDGDCDAAAGFADAVDSAWLNDVRESFEKLWAFISGADGETDVERVKRQAEEQKAYLLEKKNDYGTKWIHKLEEDFPEIYPRYSELIGVTQEKPRVVNVTSCYEIACPVDVFVYDAEGNLVVDLSQNDCYFGDSVDALRIGDRKYVDISGEEAYTIQCVGYDVGTMDVSVRVYSGSDEVRTVSFVDLSVTDTTTYELIHVADPEDEKRYTISDGSKNIPADEDSAAPMPAGIPGDVNGDNKADYSDALLILRASIGLETLTEEQQQIADVNEDGKQDYSDALQILRASIGL